MKCNQICEWNSNVGCIRPYGVPCILGNVSLTDQKTTNADRIRAMSDDELAAFLCNLRSEEAYGNACSNCVAESFCHIGHTGMIDWLRLPVEDTECT